MAHDWSLFSAGAEKQRRRLAGGGGLVGRGRRGWRTRTETKVLEQFPEDELELRKMVDK